MQRPPTIHAHRPYTSIIAMASGSLVVLAALGASTWLRAQETAQSDEKNRPPAELAVMTFNIRFNNPADGKNAWPKRRDDVAELIRRQKPDLLGLQEALAGQISDLEKRLGDDYDWYGVGRDDGKEKGEFVPVFFRRDRFDVLAKGTFWLSETPDKPGVIGWDAALPRVATWLKLKDKPTGRTLLFANVHYDHRGDKARLESSRLLRRKLLELAGDAPILLLGDFNAAPDSRPYQALVDSADLKSGDGAPAKAAVLRDARGLVAEPSGPDTTWNGFTKAVKGSRIDHVLVDARWMVASYAVIDEQTPDGRFYSDHFPIVVKLRQE